jgi:hypothetical protein
MQNFIARVIRSAKDKTAKVAIEKTIKHPVYPKVSKRLLRRVLQNFRNIVLLGKCWFMMRRAGWLWAMSLKLNMLARLAKTKPLKSPKF